MKGLLPHHLAMLRDGSGLPEDVIKERGYWSAESVSEIRELGFTRSQAIQPALVIPVHGVDGNVCSYSLRPDTPRIHPDGKAAKYEQPRGSHAVLDIPPRCRVGLGDPSMPLYITEGAKKADALAARGACAISLSGVWNWRGTNSQGGKTALADWESIALNGRQVLVVFDSDVATKEGVRGSLVRLKPFLEKRGASVRLVYLPPGEHGKQGVDDFFVAGGTLADLRSFAEESVRRADTRDCSRPEIVVTNRHLDEISDACWKVLVARNIHCPMVFQREGRLTRVRIDDAGSASLQEWSADDVKFTLERLAHFIKIRITPDGPERVPGRLPNDVVADLMTAWRKPIPVIRGVVRTPVFSADATLETALGYQERSKLYYQPAGEPVGSVPSRPTVEDVAAARALVLDEWLIDFPFADPASRAHVVAAALTPIARELVQGPTPLVVVNAPTQGTGKGYIAHSTSIVVTGAPAAVMTEPRDGDELRKRITAVLREGRSMVLLDNVKQRLDSAEMAAALTAEVWSDRLLGTNETLQLPNRALWMATGNNLQMDGEVGRRAVEIRLDAKVDRPWERTGFRHDPFLPWVTAQRHELVRALLVLVQHWVCEGRPVWQGKPMGSFESWCETIGGILETAGITGFLSNRDEMYRRADSETEEWREFIAEWADRFEERSVKAGDLSPLVRDLELLPGLVASIRGEVTEQAIKIRLGKALGRREDRRVGEWFIRRAGRDSHQKGVLYRLESAESESQAEQLSANSPHDNRSSTDATAGSAENAEGVFHPYARDSGEDASLEVQDEPGESSAYHSPQPPHPPPLDSEPPRDGAESVAESARAGTDSPQPLCRGCGQAMSVVAISNLCGGCQRGR